MEKQREAYVRPFITQLEYTTDVNVSQVVGCKLESSDTGALATGCKIATGSNVPCTEAVS